MNDRAIWPRTKSAEPGTPTTGNPLDRLLNRAHKVAVVHGITHLQEDIEAARRECSCGEAYGTRELGTRKCFYCVKGVPSNVKGPPEVVAERARPRFDGEVRPVKISVSYYEHLSPHNIARDVQSILELRTHGENVPLDAGLSFGYGVGAGWGMEHCVHVNVCSAVDPTHFIYLLLLAFHQECAYVEVDGLGWEVDQQNKWSPITG